MHVSVFTKHRDKFATAAGIVFFAAVYHRRADAEQIHAECFFRADHGLLSGGLLDTVTSVFPPAKWASSALVYGGSTGLTNLLCLRRSAQYALYCAIWWPGICISAAPRPRRKRRYATKKVDIKTAGKGRQPALGHFPQRNGRACCALPTYVMNGLISVIMAPLMVVMMMIAIPIQEVASEIGMSGASASELLSSLPQDVMMILMLIVVGFGYFFAAMNICG